MSIELLYNIKAQCRTEKTTCHETRHTRKSAYRKQILFRFTQCLSVHSKMKTCSFEAMGYGQAPEVAC